uniref:Uncharacterized protein n=1 Tax=Arundo donax TaxID=35708 RepID=A0A0A9FLR5_ARUDO
MDSGRFFLNSAFFWYYQYCHSLRSNNCSSWGVFLLGNISVSGTERVPPRCFA